MVAAESSNTAHLPDPNGTGKKIYERNKAWVKRFTKSFEGKAIGEHFTVVLGKMWKSYWQKEVISTS